ncbi:hypothetical protein GLX30_05975 [Streptomyces sp. Tu 2975]|uniref:hypothetical protein n=1 Tax=Streptomyces sp. Tu 2975 TaxID=2676871 RepID=UPI00135B900B|nr:hypothetical protein [Streptomyces sp. Tu 2975]QIP83686.1 hypothetical protein GLX30_05975 [Streptomyces sp. Tu 2975]
MARHVVRYFLTGALPPEGARCAQDLPPFVERVADPAAPTVSAGTPSERRLPGAATEGALPHSVWPPAVSGLSPAHRAPAP